MYLSVRIGRIRMFKREKKWIKERMSIRTIGMINKRDFVGTYNEALSLVEKRRCIMLIYSNDNESRKLYEMWMMASKHVALPLFGMMYTPERCMYSTIKYICESDRARDVMTEGLSDSTRDLSNEEEEKERKKYKMITSNNAIINLIMGESVPCIIIYNEGEPVSIYTGKRELSYIIDVAMSLNNVIRGNRI